MRHWGRACLAVLGCRVTVRGAPAAAPCLLVSNHISYVDILVLAAYSPARFVSKAEIADWPWPEPSAGRSTSSSSTAAGAAT